MPLSDVHRHRPGPLPALFVLAAISALLLVALRLGARLLTGDGGSFDRAILLGLRVTGDPATPIGPDWLRHFAIDITTLGGSTTLVLVIVFATGLLIARRNVRTALLLVAATASGALMVDLLKGWFARTRPALIDHLVDVGNFSFPSGHAANSAMIYLSLGTLLTRVESRQAERRFTLAVAALLALMIGASRLYLGVHWPSDVAAGWLFGTLWAMLWWTLAALLTRRAGAG
jgi:undecaprenyl-diphosphatase